jgi:sugar phosphate isomerase/epimerase
MKPISVQLYSLREQAEKDFAGVLKKVADIGYKGVEPAGFWNLTPKELKNIVTDLGMEISSTHSPWANPNNLQQVIDTAGELGIDLVACGYGPDDFKDVDAIKKTAETVNGMQEKLAAAGLTLFQHNHYWEFERIDGKLKYDIYAELCPNVMFEIDTYWSANFGAETPAEMVKHFQDRAILLHIKDGMFVKGDPMLAVGSGKMDIPSVINAAPAKTRWLVVELDACATDMVEAVAQSYKYLTENGLAAGNK